QRGLAAIKPPPGEEAVPITQFLRMETPIFKSAAPDTAIDFKTEPVKATDKADWIGAISLNGEGAPAIVTANAQEVSLSNGAKIPFAAKSVLGADLNYDFKTDLVLVGAGGVRIYRQDEPMKFTDVTAATKLPPEVVNRNYTNAWAADIEA